VKMGPIGCSETSARNYHYLLRNNPEERGTLLLCMLTVQKHRIAAFGGRSSLAVYCAQYKHLIERCVTGQGQVKLISDVYQ